MEWEISSCLAICSVTNFCVFRDCSAQIKSSQMSLLNIIHKLWGNKAIIVLQDAGIDVSGIQLDTNGLVVYTIKWMRWGMLGGVM